MQTASTDGVVGSYSLLERGSYARFILGLTEFLWHLILKMCKFIAFPTIAIKYKTIS